MSKPHTVCLTFDRMNPLKQLLAWKHRCTGCRVGQGGGGVAPPVLEMFEFFGQNTDV